jgi:hypothetical protein
MVRIGHYMTEMRTTHWNDIISELAIAKRKSGSTALTRKWFMDYLFTVCSQTRNNFWPVRAIITKTPKIWLGKEYRTVYKVYFQFRRILYPLKIRFVSKTFSVDLRVPSRCNNIFRKIAACRGFIIFISSHSEIVSKSRSTPGNWITPTTNL